VGVGTTRFRKYHPLGTRHGLKRDARIEEFVRCLCASLGAKYLSSRSETARIPIAMFRGALQNGFVWSKMRDGRVTSFCASNLHITLAASSTGEVAAPHVDDCSVGDVVAWHPFVKLCSAKVFMSSPMLRGGVPFLVFFVCRSRRLIKRPVAQW
jgi:hypothetical protein